jgi:hypothetical protein
VPRFIALTPFPEHSPRNWRVMIPALTRAGNSIPGLVRRWVTYPRLPAPLQLSFIHEAHTIRMMKRITRRMLYGVAGVVIAAVVAYGVALIDLGDEPRGYVASYSLLPHAEDDVLNFYQGKVSHQTCCGDSDWGTYERASDGSWIWNVRDKGGEVMDFRVHSGPFSMTFTATQGEMEPFTLRRRAFKDLPW